MPEPFDILIVCPSLLEPGTQRGGGIEEIDHKMGLFLSEHLNATIIGPSIRREKGRRTIDRGLSFYYLRFPAMKKYLPLTILDQIVLNVFLLPAYSFLLCIRILRMIRGERKTILIIHNGFPGFAGLIAARISSKKILFAEGNTYPWVLPLLFNRNNSILRRSSIYVNTMIGRLICEYSDCIRTQSESIRLGMIEKGIAPSKINVVSAGVDVDSFSANIMNPVNQLPMRVGFVGRLTEEKGASLLLEIIKEAKILMPDIRFVIMGDGPYRDEIIAQDNVESAEFVNRNELPSRLSGVDVILFFQNEIGLAELEAMAAGKAIVACKAGEMSDRLEDGKTAILVSPNINGFISAITRLRIDVELRNTLSRNARIFVSENYDWKKIGETWLKLISKCADSRN